MHKALRGCWPLIFCHSSSCLAQTFISRKYPRPSPSATSSVQVPLNPWTSKLCFFNTFPKLVWNVILPRRFYYFPPPVARDGGSLAIPCFGPFSYAISSKYTNYVDSACCFMLWFQRWPMKRYARPSRSERDGWLTAHAPQAPCSRGGSLTARKMARQRVRSLSAPRKL